MFAVLKYQKKKKHKLDETNKKCIFVGYSSMYKGYRLYNLKTNKVIVKQYVIYDEDVVWN